MSKPTPADAAAHLDVLWNDPEEKRKSALALEILKEQEAKQRAANSR